MKRTPHNKIIFSQEVLTEILEFYSCHMKKETAEKYNITCKVLDRLLRENNIIPHSKKAISKKEEKEICDLYKEHTASYIGRIFHIHRDRVEKIIISNGYSLHSKDEDRRMGAKDRTQTFLEKYGVSSPLKLDRIKSKIRETNLTRYGTICPANQKEFKEEYHKNLENILEKRKQTCLNRYGVEYYIYTEEYWDRRKKTNLTKYGSEEWTKSNYFYQSFPGKFWCDGISFDSLPELSIYLYFVCHNLQIERPKITFKYFSDDGEHIYHPDFKIDNKLIEVKGDHFFKNGVYINPYSNDPLDQQIAKDKWQCMLDNNVEIWKKKQYKTYVNWFNSLKIDKELFRDKNAKSDIIRRKI